MKSVAISIGDINGIGLQIALESHEEVKKYCEPIYCINEKMLQQASKLLNIDIPKDFNISGLKGNFEIKPGKVSKSSGRYSYKSFLEAISLASKNKVEAIVTMPINKEAWAKAGINYVGHTDMLRDIFKKDAIMMLGCEQMFVALYTEHIPLKSVAKHVKVKKFHSFLNDFYSSIGKPDEPIAVLGLNPHAGDNGVLGDEEFKIQKAIQKANKDIGKIIFKGPLVPDIVFTPQVRKNYRYFIALYHDQGLAPLKALYFDESINVSLNLPIKRVSVDHGTAFDKAYNNSKISNKSYINAIKQSIV